MSYKLKVKSLPASGRLRVKKYKKLLKKYCTQVFDLGLVTGKSGNLSMRISPDSFLITATGKSKGEITDRDLVVCKINTDSADKRASSEWRLHRAIYRARKDAKAVFHSQPPFTTIIACAKNKKIKKDIIPEAVAYLKKIEIIPYCHAGGIELAKKVGAGALRADVLLLENHGAVSFGPSIDEAVLKSVTLEFLCKLTVLSRAAGIELNSIPQKMTYDFLRQLRVKGGV
ncbi:MAG: class II aldolase/adducin family protein [Nitrospirae bacterium]|nr:class II aldolase/adducin family protein [Nitrospirota bacterium]